MIHTTISLPNEVAEHIKISKINFSGWVADTYKTTFMYSSIDDRYEIKKRELEEEYLAEKKMALNVVKDLANQINNDDECRSRFNLFRRQIREGEGKVDVLEKCNYLKKMFKLNMTLEQFKIIMKGFNEAETKYMNETTKLSTTN
jgi:hypothetical protein